ncbi:MAG: hypothetical protein L3J53_03755 [Proteobacteria bacterium]|nr:hypothetical protein [Pseudomonadota bacterium]
MYRITIFLIISLLVTTVLHAQNPKVAAAEDNSSDNEFKHLVSSTDVVYHLRKNYGVRGSVLLSKALARILSSFSSQQQAQNSWQAAINEIKDTRAQYNIANINSIYHTGQILSRFTNGMNQQKWYANRMRLQVNKKSLPEFLKTYDDLTIYFNLTKVWDILLIDIAKQANIQWHEVFAGSLNLFAEDVMEAKNQQKIIEFNFFEQLNQWQASKNIDAELANLLLQIELQSQLPASLYQAVIRYTLEQQDQNFLSISMTWLNVVQQLSLHKQKLSAKELVSAVKLIEESDKWFLSHTQELSTINTELPTWIKQSVQYIKSAYNNHTSSDENIELATIYQLLEPRLANYMASPFRQNIRKNLEVCLNISEEFSPFPQEPIDKNQFEGCILDITKWATTEASSYALAGSLTKVSSKDAIDRALQLPNWQIINFIYAKIATNDCLTNAPQLPNPYEWSMAAETMLWFADRWPAYTQKYPQNSQINKIIHQGERLIQNNKCLAKSKSATLDTYFNYTIQAWQDVKIKIKQVAREFNNSNLALGSDLDLLNPTEKSSNYKVANMKITACDAQAACGVHVALEAPKALFSLFPNHLLIANQLKLGTMKLCYDNIGWENRRTTPTHLNNDSVANYSGNFTFNLQGFYNDELVFSRKLVDKQEYNYLFGANTTEVLDTACPLDIIGQKISTKLAGGTYGLVPNRLTFLTASRIDEASILTGNWSKGAEWNNLIASDNIEIVTEQKFPELTSTIQQFYQQKATQLQTTIYKSMLNIDANATDTQKQLAESFASMQRYAKLLASTNYLLQTNSIMHNADLHGLFYGSNKIPDVASLNDFFQQQLNINSMIENIDNTLKVNQEKWNALDKSWSNQHIKDVLYRLSSLTE